MIKRMTIWLTIGVLLLCGCAPQTIAKEETMSEEVNLTEPLATDNSATAAPTDEIVQSAAPDALAQFACALLGQALETSGNNPVVSPLSAYLALSMAASGADGITKNEFSTLLHGDPETLNDVCGALLASLQKTNGSTKLTIANSVWSDESANIQKSYLTLLKDVYAADAFSAQLNSDKTRNAINAWVKEKTNGLIPTLRKDNYADDTMLVLLNTLYLNAKWDNPFWGQMTEDHDFIKADGTKVSSPFMNDRECHRDYLSIDGAEGILLPYDDGKTAFVALMPTDTRTARELATALTAETLAAAIASRAEAFMNLSLPKFAVDFTLDMNDPLKKLGLTSAFNPNSADFSKMGSSAQGNLFLSSVQQIVKIIVDEKGTEAAAVTEIAAAGMALNPEQPRELMFDHPFVYAVVDLDSGAPLFIGVLDEPQA
ncbi:MAG: serpin family protein [Clostridia bacterium]